MEGRPLPVQLGPLKLLPIKPESVRGRKKVRFHIFVFKHYTFCKINKMSPYNNSLTTVMLN